MTEQPSWAGDVLSYTAMRGPLPLPQWDEVSQNTLDDLRLRLRESVAESILMALKGFFIPGPLGAALDQLTQWAAPLREGLEAGFQEVIEFFTDLVGRTGLLEFLDWLWNGVSGGFAGFGATVETLLKPLFTWLGWLWTEFGSASETFLKPIFEFLEWLWAQFGATVETLLKPILLFLKSANLQSLDGNILNTIWSRLNDGAEGIGKTLADVLTSVGDFVEGLVPAITGIPGALNIGSITTWAEGVLTDGLTWNDFKTLFGEIPEAILGVLPIANINLINPELMSQGGFDTTTTLAAGSGWEWDGTTTRGSSSGSAKVTGNGTIRSLYSNQSISVAPGDKLYISCWVKSTGTVGAGAITLSVVEFSGTAVAATQSAGSAIASRASSALFVQIGSTPTVGTAYTVPAGVTSIRVKIGVTAGAATGSTVWFDDISVKKTGLLDGNWVAGVLGTVAQDFQAFIDQLFQGIKGAAAGAGSLVEGAATSIRSALESIFTTLFGPGKLSLPTNIALDPLLAIAIPGLNASKITAGSFGTGFITNGAITTEKVGGFQITGDKIAGSTIDAGTKLTGQVTDALVPQVTSTWNELYDAFDNSTTPTGTQRTLAQVRGRGAAVRSSAVTGEAQSLIAKTLAVTALQAGPNLATNPGFDNVNLFISATANRSYSTEQKRSGTQSLKMSGYIFLDLFSNETQTLYLPAVPGDRYYTEVWVYGHNSNVDTAQGIWLQVDNYDSAGVRTAFLSQVTGFTVAGNALKNVWTKLSGYFTIPANTVRFTVTAVQLSSTTPPANIYYWDDFVCYRVTESAAINGALYGVGVNTPAPNILEGAVPGLQASKITSGSFGSAQIAALAITNAKLASDLDATKLTAGTLPLGRITDNTLPGAKLIDNNVAGGKLAAGIDATKLTGQVADALVPQVTSTWNELYDAFDNSTTPVGTQRTLAQVRSRGAAVRSSAVNGESKATVAQDALNTALDSGANLCANPGFENISYALNQPASNSYSTELKRSGARSAKMVGVTGQNLDVHFFTSLVNPGVTLSVTEGDVLYFEAWIRGGTGNTKVAGSIRPYLYSGDPAAPTVSYPTNIANYSGTLADLNAGWQKISGYYTVPAGGVGLQVMVQLHTSAGTGCILHVDDMVCYRVTEAVVAENKAVAAQSSLDLRAKDFQNLVAGLDFALGAASPWVFTAGQGYTIATDQARSGTHSMKVTGSAVVASAVASYDSFRTFEVKAGDQFYIELWARRTTDYVNNNVSGPRFRMASGSGGATIVDIPLIASSLPTADTWTKLAATGTVPANGTTSVSFGMISAASTVAGSVWMDDVTVRRVVVPDQIPALAITNTKLGTDIDAGKLGAGTLPLARITDNTLPGGKLLNGDVVGAKLAANTIDAGTKLTGQVADAQVPQVTSTWNELYDAFDNSTTPTGTQRTLAQVRGRGAVVRASAVGAIDSVKAGANLIPDPGFENAQRDAERLAAAINPAQATTTHDTVVKRSGTRSLKMVHVSSQPGFLFGPTLNSSDFIPTKAGATFRLSQWVYASTSNTGTNKVGMFLRLRDSTGALADGWTSTPSELVLPSEGVWHPHEVSLTVPTGYDQVMPFFCSIRTGAVAGDTFWFDDIAAYDVTESAAINGALYGTGVNTPAPNILEGAVPGLQASKITNGTFADAQIPTITNAKLGSDISADKLTAGTLPVARIADNTLPGGKLAANTVDAGSKLTGTVADGQLGPIRDLAIGQINSGANLLPNPGFERLGFVSNALFVTEQKRSGTRSLKLTANGTNYAAHSLFSDNVSGLNVPVTPNDVYYYEIWYRGHASNPRHRQLTVTGTAGTFTITVGANTTTAIAYNATAATVQAALVALTSVGAGNATVTGTTTASPGLTIVFGASVTGAISVTSSVTGGGGPNLFNNAIFMQATSYNQNGVATGYPGISVASADDDNGVWKELAGYVTIPAGTAELPTSYSNFQQYMNYTMPAGVIYYFDDAFLARVTESNQINKALYGPSSNAPGTAILTAQVPSGIDTTKLTGILADGQIPTINNAKIGTDIDASKLSAGTLPAARIAAGAIDNLKIATGVDAAKLTTGTLPVARIAAGAITNTYLGSDVDAAKLTAGTLPLARITDNTLPGAKLIDNNVAGGKLAAGIDATKLTGQVADAQVPQAIAAQASIALKARDFSNLAAGSDFEGVTYPWVLDAGLALDTAQKNSGTQSLKLSAGTGARNASLGTYPTVFEAKPGDQYYVEFWARRDAAFSSTIDGKLRVGDQANNLVGQVALTTGADPFEGYVSALLHFDGLDGATTIYDSSISPYEWTAFGNAKLATAQSKFGGSSLALDGTGDYIKATAPSADFGFGTDNFTVEMWVRLNANSVAALLYDARPGAQGVYPTLYFTNGGALRYYVNGADRITGATAMSLNTWHHVAVSRVSGVTRMFLNGVQEGSSYTDANNYLASQPIVGAGGATATVGSAVNGYFDDLRVTKGVGRYSANFTAPAAALPDPGANFTDINVWEKKSDTFTVPAGDTGLLFAFQFNTTSGNLWIDDVVIRKVVQPDAIAALPQSKVDGLPADAAVNATLLDHTQKIQTLESTLLAAESQGKTMSVNFANYAGTSAAPGDLTDFTVEYPVGTGTSTVRVVDGQARWVTGTTADRTARIVYTGNANEDGKTLTNFQSIKGTLGSVPALGVTGVNGPRFWAIGRVSDDRTSYVWARVYFANGGLTSLTGQMGCTINGVETIWVASFPITFSLDMTFKVGANGNPRAYQVYSGTTLVTTYEEGFATLTAFPTTGATGRLYVANDTGLRYTWNGTAYVSSASAASFLGDSTTTSNYRRWGAITEIKMVSGSLRTGGSVVAAVTSDNAVSPYKGSVARMIRTSATTTTLAAGETALSPSFFVTDYETLDVDSDDVNGTFTVNKSKMYMVSARIRLSASFTSNCYVILQKWNGTAWVTVQDGDSIWPFDSFHNNQGTNYALSASWLQYLNAGDKVRLATWRENGSSSVLRGESTGVETYFAIAGLT